MAKKINITAQLNAATTDGILADAGQIFDAKKGKFQEQVNQEFDEALDEAITSEETDKVVESIEEGIIHNALRKTEQILTEAEKEQARENIGVVSRQTFEGEAVRVKKQVFTSEQKYQARHNISAITAEEAEKIAQDKINETAVSAPDKLQAVKELSSWLEENPDSAATMNAAIQENAADIAMIGRNTGLDEYLEFSTGMNYSAGDVVMYDGVLFRFKAEHAKGDWDYNEVEEWSEKKEREERVAELGQQVIYDVSKNNDGATFASLSALLSSENLSTLIPIVVRCGGMSIRFVQSSDNKYVQYRLMSDTFNTTTSNWQGVDEEPTAGSENLIESGAIIKHNIDTAFVGDVKKTMQFAGFLSPDKIETYGSATFSVIKVNGGDSLEVENTNGTKCFFVKSFNFGFTLPYTPDLCSGETGRRVLTNTTLPADAEYIIMQYNTFDGSNVLPKKLIIGGVNYTVSNDLSEALSKGSAASKELGLDNIYTHKAYINSEGGITSSSDWYCSDLIPLDKIYGDFVELEVTTNGHNSPQKYAWAFYNAQEQFVNGSITGATKIDISSLEDGITYIRLSSYNRSRNRILNYSERKIDENLVKEISDTASIATTALDKINIFAGTEVLLENVLDYSAFDDNGSWILRHNSYKGVIIKCYPDVKYKITNNNNGNNQYSLLKSASTDIVDYCTGTHRNPVSANSSVEFITPQDANYIWLMTLYGNVDYTPSIEIVGDKEKLVAPLSNDIDFMEDAAKGIENAEKYTGWLDGSSAKIVYYGDPAKYCRVNISGKKKVRIVAKKDAVSYVEITKDFEAKNTTSSASSTITLPLATGETGRREILANSITEITIPDDAVYAVFQYIRYNGIDICPLSISVDGFEFVNYAKYNPYPTHSTYIDQKEVDNLHSSLAAYLNSNSALTFIHTSDTHLKNGNSKCFENIMSFLNDKYIDCLVHTGDIVWDNFPNNDASGQGYDIFANFVNNATKDVIFTVGNHDVGGESKNTAICGTDAQVYNTFYAPFMKSNFVSEGEGEGKCSYYVDYAAKKVRFISLYQYNTDYEMSGSELKDIRGRQAWRQAEIDWFCTTLNSTPEGYAIFVLTHEVETLGNKTNDWQSIITAGHQTSINNHLLTDIVTAFVNRTTVNTSLTQAVGVVGTITANYDFVNAKGYFAAFLNGHLHDDFVGKEKNSDLNVINKCCDNMLYQAGCTTRHIPNTYNENTINVVTVYPTRRLIKVMRIGAKYSSEGDYRNVTYMQF